MKLHRLAAEGDIAGIQRVLAKGIFVDSVDEEGRTPLLIAATSRDSSVATMRFLIEQGANVNAAISNSDGRSIGSLLGVAVKSASIEKVKALIEAGGDTRFVDPNGYSILLKALFGSLQFPTKDFLPLFGLLIDAGAPLNVESKYGESVLTVSSNRGEFAKLRYFLDRGADPKPLLWSPLFFAIAFGDLPEIEAALMNGVALEDRDHWERTPFLLSVHVGKVDAAKLLLELGADRQATGRCGRTALMYAIERADANMLKWLISEGWDVEQTDEFGGTSLVTAVGRGAAQCLEVLLEAGAVASRRDKYGDGPMKGAESPEIVKLLVAAGEELSEVESSSRPKLLGLNASDPVDVSGNDYRANKHRKFGRRNPDRMNNPFWEAMVRTRWSAYAGAAHFGEGIVERSAVWCAERFGQSLTLLPDGRYVEIAGEHEDFYDPDFCIYNDVVVYRGDGTFDIFGYAESAFTPTDFHSATFVAPYIYIIGNLGYPKDRCPGSTSVYRLHTETWSIQQFFIKGENPGWIHGHKARLLDGDIIQISGGKIVVSNDVDLLENTRDFYLDIASQNWTTR